jgi:hypothetical protein
MEEQDGQAEGDVLTGIQVVLGAHQEQRPVELQREEGMSEQDSQGVVEGLQ